MKRVHFICKNIESRRCVKNKNYYRNKENSLCQQMEYKFSFCLEEVLFESMPKTNKKAIERATEQKKWKTHT